MKTRAMAWNLGLGLLLTTSLAALTTVGCGGGRQRNGGGGDGDGSCVSGTHRCDGLSWQSCNGGAWVNAQSCTGSCDVSLGCTQCPPGGAYCQGNDVYSCDAQGNPGSKLTHCDGGCINGTCTDPCTAAASEFSYLGCDYWPTVTVNSLLTDKANFAVAIANPNSDPVTIKVFRLGKQVKLTQIDPGGLQTMTLPWVAELKQSSVLSTAAASVLAKGGAYQLSASLPITAYQFNPLEFQTSGSGGIFGTSEYTYTNDASLLLPMSTLTGNYIVIARPTTMTQTEDSSSWGKISGFFSVTAAETGTTNVKITFTAPTLASKSGTAVSAFQAGQTGQFQLQQGDVLQILSAGPASCTPQSQDDAGKYCDLGAAYDLTGTEINADQKVAVYSGHDCSFVPYDKWACDHLEESMLPIESWGKQYLAIHTQRQPSNIPDLWRVVSGADNNTISFNPASVHAPITLNRGEWMEFPSSEDFEAGGTGAFALAQYMVGENYYSSSATAPGDPAMTIAVPLEQYRDSYIFLLPATYTLNYLNVSVPTGATVTLDGATVDASKFTAVGSGSYSAARLQLEAGTHTISATEPFGIAAYGLASYTSYMYPGGLDVKQINIQ